jgi:hypothetical protein
MDGIDPLRGGLPFQGVPMTDEVSAALKKKVKEAKMETPTELEASEDLSDLSPEAAKLSRPQFEAFLESAKESILSMNREAENFTEAATQHMVGAALEKKFGDKFKSNPGYAQMEEKLTKFILNDPESRAMVENMIDLMYAENQG